MKVKELAAKLNELFRQGHGDLAVYFRESSPVAFPIVEVNIETLLFTPNPDFNPNVVCLHWRKNESKRRDETSADGCISDGIGPGNASVDTKQKYGDSSG